MREKQLHEIYKKLQIQAKSNDQLSDDEICNITRQLTECEVKNENELELVLKIEGMIQREKNINANREKKSVKPRQCADIIMKHCHFVTIGNRENNEKGELFIYTFQGIYKRNKVLIARYCLFVQYDMPQHQRNEVISFIETLAVEGEQTINENLIPLKNGIYNLNTKTLDKFSHEYVFFTKVDTDYNKNAKEAPVFKDWDFERWIEEISDGLEDKERLIWIIFYMTINYNYVTEAIIFLVSRMGKTSKGTFQSLLISMVGKNNACAKRLNQLEQQFGLGNIVNKQIIVGDDNSPDRKLVSIENAKTIATGDFIEIENKGKDAFSMRLTPLIIQSFNGIPRFESFDKGVKRRLLVLEFHKVFQGNDNNKKVKNKYIHDKRLHEYIVYKVLHDESLMKFDGIEDIDTVESKSIKNRLEEKNTPILLFINEILPLLVNSRMRLDFLYWAYLGYIEKDGLRSKYSRVEFTDRLKPIMLEKGYEFKSGKLTGDYDFQDFETVRERIRGTKNENEFYVLMSSNFKSRSEERKNYIKKVNGIFVKIN